MIDEGDTFDEALRIFDSEQTGEDNKEWSGFEHSYKHMVTPEEPHYRGEGDSDAELP